MSQQQAFEATVSRIGNGKELKTEFIKNRRLMSLLETELVKREWDLKWGPVLHLAITTGIFLFIGVTVLSRQGHISEMTPFERMSNLVALVVFYSLSCAGFLGQKFFPVILNRGVRLAIYAAGSVLVTFWVMIFIAHANLNVNQFITAFLWAFFVPFGAFNGLVLGLERTVLKKI